MYGTTADLLKKRKKKAVHINQEAVNRSDQETHNNSEGTAEFHRSGGRFIFTGKLQITPCVEEQREENHCLKKPPRRHT